MPIDIIAEYDSLTILMPVRPDIIGIDDSCLQPPRFTQELQSDRESYARGDTVKLTFLVKVRETDDGDRARITVRRGSQEAVQWGIYVSGRPILRVPEVLTPRNTTFVFTGETYTFFWDQRDAAGEQVPPSEYKAFASFLSADCPRGPGETSFLITSEAPK